MREKLIELLESVPQPELLYGQPLIGVCKVADHLIANGVTIGKDNNVPSKWIPVTERLPKEFVTVLVYAPQEQPLQTVHEAYLANGCFSSRLCIFGEDEVTHWMPMPEPPKTT